MLVRQTNVAKFSLAFSCDELNFTSHYFSIFITGIDAESDVKSKIVWSANRNHPVGDNALLNFTAAGELVLTDGDGTIVWTTNTAGKSVAGMNLTETGNLVLFDHQSSVVWQSFDHPTDCLLPGQKLFQGQELKSSVSLYNMSEGMFSLQVTDLGLDAYVKSNPPQAYFSTILASYPREEKVHIRFMNGSLSFFMHSFEPSGRIDIPEAS
ncbi:putative bulb-type lectin domain-containing protein [Helianthus debilis subsp. tardiflorus]